MVILGFQLSQLQNLHHLTTSLWIHYMLWFWINRCKYKTVSQSSIILSFICDVTGTLKKKFQFGTQLQIKFSCSHKALSCTCTSTCTSLIAISMYKLGFSHLSVSYLILNFLVVSKSFFNYVLEGISGCIRDQPFVSRGLVIVFFLPWSEQNYHLCFFHYEIVIDLDAFSHYCL